MTNATRGRTWSVTVRLTCALLLLSVVTSCDKAESREPLTSRGVDAPVANYGSLAWMPGGSLYASLHTINAAGEVIFRLVRVDGGDLVEVNLPPVEGCSAESVAHVSALPDGRLGYALECASEPGTHAFVLRAYDPMSGADSELGRMPFRPIDYSFSPEMDEGLVSRSNAMCAIVARIVGGNVAPLELEVASDGARMNLADEPIPSPSRCTEFGRAANPDWSGNGAVAFFASPESMGLDGVARLDAPWSLYLMDAEELVPREVLSGIDSAYQLGWSPDGQWLAFSCDAHGDQTGTFLYSPETEELQWVAREPWFGIAWSEDSSRLRGLIDDEGETRRIVEVALPSVGS